MPPRVSIDVENRAVDGYLSGRTTIELGEELGISSSCVSGILKRNNINRRTPNETHRRHHFNQRFFQSVDSEEKAYWLGFITADGTVHNHSYTIRINLSSKDRSHLVKYCDSLSLNSQKIIDCKTNKKEDGTRREMSYIPIQSKLMFDDLANLGISSNKTFSVNAWQGPHRLMGHYWRGVWDGDGSLRKTLRKKHPEWVFDLCGSLSMMNSFSLFLCDRLGFAPNVFPMSSIFRVRITGVMKVQSIIKLLFEDATIFLDRKKTLADECLSQESLKDGRQPLKRLTRKKRKT